jgi:hypothetical protein
LQGIENQQRKETGPRQEQLPTSGLGKTTKQLLRQQGQLKDIASPGPLKNY